MFVKKTNCDKYLMSLTVQELSALRVMASWYNTVSVAVTENYIAAHTTDLSYGNPKYIFAMLSTVWLHTAKFRDEISNAG